MIWPCTNSKPRMNHSSFSERKIYIYIDIEMFGITYCTAWWSDCLDHSITGRKWWNGDGWWWWSIRHAMHFMDVSVGRVISQSGRPAWAGSSLRFTVVCSVIYLPSWRLQSNWTVNPFCFGCTCRWGLLWCCHRSLIILHLIALKVSVVSDLRDDGEWGLHVRILSHL